VWVQLQMIYIIYSLKLQVEVQDREVAEAGMNHIKYIAFLYFPKNYTKGLTKYIDDRQYYDLESRVFADLTNDSKYS